MKQTVGIPLSVMNQVYAHQIKDQWCWSACITMILKRYGVTLNQYVLARDICGIDEYGNACNCPAFAWQIDQSINIKGVDALGYTFSAHGEMNYGRPDLFELVNELIEGRPVMVTYTNPDGRNGHAVLITGCEYEIRGTVLTVSEIFVRDPAKTTENIISVGRRRAVNPRGFLNAINNYWYVRVRRSQYSNSYRVAG